MRINNIYIRNTFNIDVMKGYKKKKKKKKKERRKERKKEKVGYENMKRFLTYQTTL